MPATYVSAEWIEDPAGTRSIKAIGDDGQEYWIPSVDTDVPPWPEFLKTEAGRQFVASAET